MTMLYCASTRAISGSRAHLASKIWAELSEVSNPPRARLSAQCRNSVPLAASSLRCEKRDLRYFSSGSARANGSDQAYPHHDDAEPLAPEFEAYKQSINFRSESVDLSLLSTERIGWTQTIHGYLGPRQFISKKLTFATLFNPASSHSVQLVFHEQDDKPELLPCHLALKKINESSPVVVQGVVQARKLPASADQSTMEPHQLVELAIFDIKVLNEFPNHALFAKNSNFAAHARHLQIRYSKGLRDALSFRHQATRLVRNYLDQRGFIEVETPILFKSTPEGAREFLVPTRAKGQAYALPQSPQQYKQILMASGVPRYFQFAKCFRDEDLRADRQPEFTQLDLELAFVKQSHIRKLVEEIIKMLWKTLLNIEIPKSMKFPVMSYTHAMATYGSDKPDVRLGMEIQRIGTPPGDLSSKITSIDDPAIDAIVFHVSDSAAETRKFVKEFMESPDAAPFNGNPDGQPGVFIFDSAAPLRGLQAFGFEAADKIEQTFQLKDGDLLVLQARQDAPFSGGSTPIGNLRLALHRAAVEKGLVEPPSGFEFCWIVDFPLFSPQADGDADPGQGGSAGIRSTHHPFTAPKTEKGVHLLQSDPLSVTADHYDLVVNGVELGGGSRRIHSAEVQEFVLRDVLKMSEDRLEDFRHLLDALRAGCPPHAGIALGFDRLIAVMLEKSSVRDVIAFPKSGDGKDLLVKSPTMMTKEQLDTYHLRLKED